MFKNPLLFALLSVLLISTCSKQIGIISAEKQLLISNEIQREAHLINDAALLTSQIADTMIGADKGDIKYSSNQSIKDRFENYFSKVKYTTWDDVQPPSIYISEDATLASVYVKKLLDIQYKNEGGALGEHQYSLFSWNSDYKKSNDQWKIIGATSTSKSLTEEEAQNLPIHHSTTYATLEEKDLIPEGVAFDSKRGTAYLSSTYKRKIVGISSDGKTFDFKKEQEGGLWSTLGMEVDEKNDLLWVVSFHGNEVLPLKNPDSASEWKSKIYVYQLPNGELKQIYEPKIEGKVAFNDLSIADNSGVFISESVQNKVYHLNPEEGSFKELNIQDSTFIFPNGITLSENNQYLYIANQGGILQYNLQNETHRCLSSNDLTLNGIDGLAYYKGTLVANQSYRKRILQLSLDENKGVITSQRILEANHPSFNQPATGEVVGDSFIYLGNAQMRSGFSEGRIKELNELEKPILLKVKLLDELY